MTNAFLGGSKAHFPDHQVMTVPEAGWAGKKNGELLRAASGLIDVFITVDSNLAYQQHIAGLAFAVIVLRAHSNRLADVVQLVPQIIAELGAAKPGQIVRVGG